MKAMIFAAGLGTRLKPLTNTMPKAMVPIGGKPLLQHVIEKLASSGFNEIIVNVHHFPEQITRFLKENNNFGLRIEISDESDLLLDTGGGIRKASSFFDDGKPFLIHNVDILSNVDLRKLYNHHIESKETVSTLLVSSRETSRYLLFDNQNKLYGWVNKTTGEIKSPYPEFNLEQYNPYAFSGIHILSPEIFPLMENFQKKFSIIDFYLSIAAKTTIKAFPDPNLRLIDVGKINSLAEAERFINADQITKG